MQLQQINRAQQSPQTTSTKPDRQRLQTSISDLPLRCIIDEISQEQDDRLCCSKDETQVRVALETYKSHTFGQLTQEYKEALEVRAEQATKGLLTKCGAALFGAGLAIGVGQCLPPGLALALGVSGAFLPFVMGNFNRSQGLQQHDALERELRMVTDWASRYVHGERILPRMGLGIDAGPMIFRGP